MDVQIRPFTPSDLEATAQVWHTSGLAAYPYLPTWQDFKADHALRVFRDVIVPQCQIWLACVGEQIVGFLALDGDLIDRLYILPSHQGQGISSKLINLAKQLSPDGLRLYTHQENKLARQVYEHHGFIVAAFGISPPPESAPDVLYEWWPSH
jgi:GNAT superfamily N-acetyltransferase